MTAPSRKRQKKTDSRVAELEKKINALEASLLARGQGSEAALDPAIAQAEVAALKEHRDQLFEDSQWNQGREGSPAQESPRGLVEGSGMKRKMTQDFPFPEQGRNPPAGPMQNVPVFPAMWGGNERKMQADGEYLDVIDRKIVDENTTYRAFDRYHMEMSRYLPMVVFPLGTKAADIRRTKPALFLSILAISISAYRPDLQPQLIGEITRLIADRVIYRGEKSLELLQAIQVLSIYYQPPERYEELNFNQMIHIGVVLALDLGMGKRTKPGMGASWREYMDKKLPLIDPNAAETRRAWLGSYYLSAKYVGPFVRFLASRLTFPPTVPPCRYAVRYLYDGLPITTSVLKSLKKEPQRIPCLPTSGYAILFDSSTLRKMSDSPFQWTTRSPRCHWPT